jgi:outer membrane protein assembly factor BamB
VKRDMTIRLVLTAAAVALLSLSVCKKPQVGEPPATPATPAGDTSGGINSDCVFHATTTDPDNDSVCFRFQWGNGDTSVWSSWVASGETATVSHTWADSGAYSVTAQAKDQPGNSTGWSAALAVRISPAHAPNAPGAPAGPPSAPPNGLCAFKTATADPDGDSICYRFDWGDADTSNWSGWVASGETAALIHVWTDTGSYAVRAQAKDRSELVSGWSVAADIIVDLSNHAPNPPAIPTGPSTAPMDSACVYSSVTTDPDGDGVSYRFDWGNGDTSAWTAWAQSGEPGNATYAYDTTGTYQVRAQARDANEARSAWSSPLSVTVTIPYGSPRWRFQTGATVDNAPAIAADGTVLIGSWDGRLYAINPDGSLKWSYDVDSGGITTAVAIAADGTIYFGAGTYLYAISPTGSLSWRYQNTFELSSSPAIAADGTIYVGSFVDLNLCAVHPDGTLKWRKDNASGMCTPAVATDGTIYVGSNDHRIYAIRPNGTTKWTYQTGNEVHGSPAVGEDGTVYIGSGDSYLYAMNPDSSLKWRYRTDDAIFSPSTIAADGTVYIGSDDGYLYAIDAEGTAKWRYHTGGWIRTGAAIAADGTIYFGSYDSCLYAIDPDGSLRWRCATGGPVTSSPAIAADGTVYFGSRDWSVYAIWGESPLATSPWPKFHHDSRNTGRVGGGR